MAGGRSAGHAARRHHRGGARASSARWCRTSAASRTRTGPTGAPSWRSPRRCTRPTTRTTGRRSARTRISRRPRVDDVRAFFERFYRPSNASLVIAGDFDPAEARALVETYFGWQPTREPPPRAPPPPAPRLAADVEIDADRPRPAAAPAARLALAGAVRAGRRRSGSGGARPRAAASRAASTGRWCSSGASPRTSSPTRARRCSAACSTSAPRPSPSTTSPRSAAAVDAELVAPGARRADRRPSWTRARNTPPGRLLQEPRPPADARRPAEPLPAPAGRSRRRRARRRPLRAPRRRASVRDAFARAVAGKRRLALRTLPESAASEAAVTA